MMEFLGNPKSIYRLTNHISAYRYQMFVLVEHCATGIKLPFMHVLDTSAGS